MGNDIQRGAVALTALAKNSPQLTRQGTHHKIAGSPSAFLYVCISLPSHIFFLDAVEETYNKDPSLYMHLKKSSFNSHVFPVLNVAEHYLYTWIKRKRLHLKMRC